MGSNFHTPWVDKPTFGYTVYTAASMNPALASLDRGITYLKNVMVGYAGSLSWVSGTGTLTWSGEIEFRFTDANGDAKRNYVAAGNIVLADDEFAYVDLSETNDALLVVAKAAIPAGGSDSNFIAYNRLVLGYRESADTFYPLALRMPLIAGGDYVPNALFDAHTILKADADDTPEALVMGEETFLGRITSGEISAIAVTEATLLGRATGGNLGARSMADVRSMLGNLDGREQAITCADNVTIDWSLGATAYMAMDRATAAITLSNGVNGRVYRLRIAQVAGGQGVTWVTTIKWRGGSAPTLTPTAGYSDFITLVQSNSVWYGDATMNFPS